MMMAEGLRFSPETRMRLSAEYGWGEVDPVEFSLSSLVALQYLGNEQVFSLVSPAVKFAEQMGGLALKESSAMHMALQNVGPDLRPSLQVVLPQFLERLPDNAKARKVATGILFGRDFDFSVKEMIPDYAGLELMKQRRFMPEWEGSQILGFRHHGKRAGSMRLFMGFRPIRIEEKFAGLFGNRAGGYAPLLDVSWGRYSSGVRYMAFRLGLGNGDLTGSSSWAFPGPFFQVQVSPEADLRARQTMSPYSVLSWDGVRAKGKSVVDRRSGSANILWHREFLTPGMAPRYDLRRGVLPMKNVSSPSRADLESTETRQRFLEREIDFVLDEEAMEILSRPLSIGSLASLEYPDQVVGLGRVVFKVTEGESALALTQGGRDRLVDAYERVGAMPALDDRDVSTIQALVEDLEHEQWEALYMEAEPGRMKEMAEQFARNMLVAIGMNPGRFWRYFSGMQLNRLMPALKHLDRHQVSKITEELFAYADGQVERADFISAQIIGDGPRSLREELFNGVNASELAYDAWLSDKTYRGTVPEYSEQHMEFGWKKMARILRKYVQPELAHEYADDADFLVAVFDMLPNVAWA